ncbi:uncharacterized protein LOC111624223, partial [Centruroides sculpturatus]|uniref:uncharacterized protein LOC111624223 n=1 Tax=Centruroides sculpturatus TaxID=218467 RepID=UPI000C6DF755
RQNSYSIDEDLDNISFISSSSSSSEVEDPSDECIDDIAFLQSLNLIQKKELQTRSVSQLKKIFPLRKISRTKACNKHHCIDMLENIKIFEETELCSPLGRHALDSCRKQLTKKESTELVKKYEKYCQISVLSIHPNTVNLPQLRCRETLKYPVTYRPNKNLKSWCHQYTFGHRQRNLRYRTLKTGLNEKSRKLKKLCKKVQILVPRLSKVKIPDTKPFKMKNSDDDLSSVENCEDDNYKNLVLNSDKVSNLEKFESESESESKESETIKIDFSDAKLIFSLSSRKPIVLLENIIDKLVWIGNNVYIKDTNIWMTEKDITLLNIDKPPNILRMKKMSWIRNNSKVTEWVPLVNKFNILRQKQNIDENKQICKEIQNNSSNSVQNCLLKDAPSSFPKQILSEANGKLKRILTCSNACSKFKNNLDITVVNGNYASEENSLLHDLKKRLNSHNVCISDTNSCYSNMNMNLDYATNNQLLEGNPKILENTEFWGKPYNGNGDREILSPQKYFPNSFNYSFFEDVTDIHFNQNNNSILMKKNSSNEDKTETKNKSEITITPCWPSLRYSNVKSCTSPLKRNISKVLPIQENGLSNLECESEISSNEINSSDIEILPDIQIENNQQPKTSSYIFRCHGCGHNASFKTNHQLLNSAHYHMMMYHSVMDPSTFLSHSHTEYVDRLELTVEAFPSYKSSNLSPIQV